MDSIPEDIMVQCIVSKIPESKDLAAMAMVSKGWRRMASLATRLSFDFQRSWKQELSSRSREAERAIAVAVAFSSSIRCLELRFSPTECWLDCIRESAIQGYLSATVTSLEELRLSNKGCAYSDLLAAISCCRKLRCLDLDSGFFDCEGFPPPPLPSSLKVARFSNIIFGGDDLNRLIANCPEIQELHLDRCFATQCEAIVIASSSLRRLSIIDCSLARVLLEAPRLTAMEVKGARVELGDCARRSLQELSVLSPSSSPIANTCSLLDALARNS